MEIKSFGRAALVATLMAISTVTPLAAMAEPTPAPTSEPARNPMEQFRIDRENYNKAMAARALNIRNINFAFKNACDKAALDFKNTMATARTPDQKNIAAQARKNAISAAIVARDNAIAALGPEPLPPIEPAKQPKGPKNKSR
jgi:hypothetical protein